MGKYEYKKWDCDDRDLNNETLNEFGREGWELVTHSIAVIPIEEYRVSEWHYFIFRTPLVPAEENCNDDDGWSYDECQEHQKYCETIKRSKRTIRAMIPEEICTYEVVKLAKEKGCNI